MPTTDGPDYDAKCELCQENPARRSDIEYRASNPSDPWMMLCDECDSKTKGRTPPRNGGAQIPGNDEFGPQAAARRLEFLKYELRIDMAIFLRLSKKPLPKKFAWLNKLSETTVNKLSDELFAVKDRYAGLIYGPRGYGHLEEGLARYKTIMGTYQIMSGVGDFTGQKPEQPPQEAPV